MTASDDHSILEAPQPPTILHVTQSLHGTWLFATVLAYILRDRLPD
jgi:hypothetical protein